jgi:CBS domain containing-hemolysin-like protein
VVLVLFSGFLAGSEVALFSLSRFQLRSLKEQFRGIHRRIKRLLSDPSGLLITILVVNEVVNISISTLVAEAVSRNLQTRSWIVHTLADILVTAPILLFFCEVTPKVVAARANQAIAVLSARSLTIIYELLKPVRYILRGFVSSVARLAGGPLPITAIEPGTKDRPLLRETEFLHMVEEGHREGAIHESELELIKKVFELDDRTVSQIHTSIAQVYSLPGTTPIKAAQAAMRAQRFSRIPVTGKNRRDVVGVLYYKDLLFTKLDAETMQSRPISELMRDPLVVRPDLRLNSLFRRMKQNKTHLAVMESVPGEAIGIVTMDDILDAMFEELLEDEAIDGRTGA